MLQVDPSHRLTIEEIKAHPWLQGPMPEQEMIVKEFARRKQRVDKEAQIQQ